MTKRTWLRVAAISGAAMLGVTALAAPAYASDTASGGGLSCGPDQQVRISTQTTTNGVTTHGWTTTGGTTYATGFNFQYSQTTYTGSRSIRSWSATTAGTFISAGVACS
jgi:hypothetical protein